MTWVALMLAAAPAESFAHFQMEVGGFAVGVVELARDGSSFTYRSRPFFGPAREHATALPVVGPMPEGLWLWSVPPTGCVSGLDELTEQTGPLCATEVSASAVEGTMLGQPFSARYRGGTLNELTVGSAHFTRAGAKQAPRGNPFTAGFALGGTAGSLTLEPAVAGLRRASPRPVGQVVKEGACLEAANDYVAAHPGAEVVLGLVVEGTRAFPHAWVREGGAEVDPSAVGSAAEAAGSEYLAFPRAQAGRLYLELLSGQRRAVRAR